MNKNNIQNLNKHIWEGWRVCDFIERLEPFLDIVMDCDSYSRVINTKDELAEWCANNQPYYKKVIPEVVEYFANKYNIK